ncbi:uncharacterized protein LOC143864886 [Tasmannia lanceolata]|uniref:uncharacterized protein LOC143864886 n=1 Tax=Tasmannia lanceolata TaxID=3420 RepID=UPI004064BCF6
MNMPSRPSWGARSIFKAREEANQLICCVIGDGKGIDFWKQPWHPDGFISHLYPEGRILNTLPQSTTVDNLLSNGEWIPTNQRTLPGLHPILNSALIIPGNHNQVIWKPHVNGNFTLTSACWIPPDEGRFKLNSDTSLCQTEVAIGGLVRDSNSSNITAFSINMPPKSIQELEMQAILVGPASARKLGLNHLWIESDSLFAINAINGKIKCLWKQIPILFNLKALLSEFQSWKITHIWREANSAPDLVSKTNCCIKVEDLPPSNLPPDLMALVLDDSSGTLYTRL